MFGAYMLQGFLPFIWFVLFLVSGIFRERLTWKGVVGFVVVAGAALLIAGEMDTPPYLYSTFVIVLDIILLLKVFKGDIPLR